MDERAAAVTAGRLSLICDNQADSFKLASAHFLHVVEKLYSHVFKYRSVAFLTSSYGLSHCDASMNKAFSVKSSLVTSLHLSLTS